MPTKKEVSLCIFTPTEVPSKWRCSLCSKERTQNVGTGWSNLYSHISAEHPERIANFVPTLDSSQSSLDSFILPVTKQARNIAKWIEWVIMDDLPFSFVDRERTRLFTSLDPICRNTFKKYFHLLVKKVKAEIEAALPSTFGLLFDGWSLGSEHYLAIFATWTMPISSTVKTALLSCYVQDDIDDAEYLSDVQDSDRVFGLTAEDQFDCIIDVLMSYGRTLEDCQHMEKFVEFMTGDNCSTNVKMARKAKIPFVGCKSHLLNLDVQAFIGREPTKTAKKRKAGDAVPAPAAPGQRSIVQQVDKLCGKLSTIKNAAVLRAGGVFASPARINATRWYSTHTCLTGYVDKFHTALQNLHFGRDHADVVALIPTPSQFVELKALLLDLDKFESISLALQRDNLLLHQAHALLARLRADTRKELCHIDPKYADKHDYHLNFDFESAIVKIQRNCESDLSEREKDAVKLFKRPVAIAGQRSPDYAAEILSNIETTVRNEASAYRCTHHVAATSNCVERLFSMCKRTMTDHRKNMGPESLEGSVLLRMNADLWLNCAPQIIQEIINEEAHSARAARETALTSPAASDITTDFDFEM